MKKNERVYICKSCGATFDRDVNAAINIEREGLRIKQIPRESRDFKPVEIITAGQDLAIGLGQVRSLKQEATMSLG